MLAKQYVDKPREIIKNVISKICPCSDYKILYELSNFTIFEILSDLEFLKGSTRESFSRKTKERERNAYKQYDAQYHNSKDRMYLEEKKTATRQIAE